MNEKERYATAEHWSSVFREEEGRIIPAYTILDRLGRSGVLSEHCYYSESDVRSQLADVLNDLPHTDYFDGVFRIGGKWHGSPYMLSRRLDVSIAFINSIIEQHSLQGIQGRDDAGLILNFYPEEELKELCSQSEGPTERYGTIERWVKYFSDEEFCPVRKGQVRYRLAQNGIEPRLARAGGRASKVYSESEVRNVCKKLLLRPYLLEEGLAVHRGDRYITLEKFTDTFRSQRTCDIRRAIELWKLEEERQVRRTFVSRSWHGIPGWFYREDWLKPFCDDLVAKITNDERERWK